MRKQISFFQKQNNHILGTDTFWKKKKKKKGKPYGGRRDRCGYIRLDSWGKASWISGITPRTANR